MSHALGGPQGAKILAKERVMSSPGKELREWGMAGEAV